MVPRLSIHARQVDGQFRLELSGTLDGSTACQVLEAIAAAPRHDCELVIDLAGVSELEPFGFDVLCRRLPSCLGGRPVRLTGARPLAASSSGF